MSVGPKRLLLGLVILFAFPPDLKPLETPCLNAPALLTSTEPVYPDAMKLKQELVSKGFAVYCIFPTHLWSIFEVEGNGATLHLTIEGEANFRTNYGDVEVVFMPKPQTFADFKITEHREDGGFFYTFAGTPPVWATNRYGSARRIYFLDHANQLFFVGDVALLHRLEKALNARHRSL
jgi:hypothetical protein